MIKPNLLPNDFDFENLLPDWRADRSVPELIRVFVFKDFKIAFQFMTLCANFAEEIDHHPDWSNAWNTVSVRLSTHSEKALTELDSTMAFAMDRFARELMGQ